jgi:hypothetical protein
MNKDDLIVCIGNFLEKHEFLQASSIQNQIIYATDKKVLVPISEIVEVLDFLVLAGFIEVHTGNIETPETCIYIRFLPPLIRKKLKKL